VEWQKPLSQGHQSTKARLALPALRRKAPTLETFIQNFDL